MVKCLICFGIFLVFCNVDGEKKNLNLYFV